MGKRFPLRYVALFFLTLALTSGYSFAGYKRLQGPEHRAPDRFYDVLHYRLELQFDIPNKTLQGRTTITLVPFASGFSQFWLHAAEMDIHRVSLDNGVPLRFEKQPDSLLVWLDRPYTDRDTLRVAVEYTVKEPRKGLYFLIPGQDGSRKYLEIYTHGEMEDNHYWFPCWDFPNDRATSEVIATVPDSLMVISNGRLVKVREDSVRRVRTYHWKMDFPHVSYLISFVVGNYVRLVDSYKDIPVEYYVHPDRVEHARLSLRRTPEMIRFFSEKIGYDYPFNKYAQVTVTTFMFGGMENITATTLQEMSALVDRRTLLDRSPEGLVSHELAHQWWGNLLTCRDWANSWLNEGFATYFASLWTEYSKGPEAFQYEMWRAASPYFSEDSLQHRRPLVWYRYRSPLNLFDRHAYLKGAWVLHMLRYVLGEELFWKAIRYYAHTYANQCVEAQDLKRAIEEATGKNLYWFFDQWVYKAGYPEFQVSYQWDKSRKELTLVVRQVQELDELTPLFRMPVEVEITTPSGKTRHRIEVQTAADTFSFPCEEKPLLVRFDKGYHVLKTLDFQKEKEEWLYQLAHDDDVAGRLEALKALKPYKDEPEVQEALARCLRSDSFWAVRREAARVIASVRTEWAKKQLLAALQDPKSRVRRVVVAGLGKFQDSTLVPVLREVFWKDSSYSVQAAAVRAIVAIDSAGAFPFLKEVLSKQASVADFLYGRAIWRAVFKAFVDLDLKDAIPLIRKYSDHRYPSGLRLAAVRTLGRLGRGDESAFQCLLQSLQDSSGRVRRQAALALGSFGDPRALKPLEAAFEREKDKSVKRSMEVALRQLRIKAGVKEE